MNRWVVSGVWTMEKLEYNGYYTNINKEWVHNNNKSGDLFSYTNGAYEIFCWVLCCEVLKFLVKDLMDYGIRSGKSISLDSQGTSM